MNSTIIAAGLPDEWLAQIVLDTNGTASHIFYGYMATI